MYSSVLPSYEPGKDKEEKKGMNTPQFFEALKGIKQK